MTENEDQKILEPTEEMVEPEPDNLDQTDFIDNSSFSFGLNEIFPSDKEISQLLVANLKGEGGQTEADKAGKSENSPIKNDNPLKLLPKWLWLVLGGVGIFFVVLIIILIVLARGNNSTFNNDQPSEQTVNQQQIDQLLEERVTALEALEDTLVLPQTRELIVP